MRRPAMLLMVAFTFAMSSLASAGAMAEGDPLSNQFWWPEQLDLAPLRQHGAESNPLGDDFDYAKAFGQPRPRCRQEGHRGS